MTTFLTDLTETLVNVDSIAVIRPIVDEKYTAVGKDGTRFEFDWAEVDMKLGTVIPALPGFHTLQADMFDDEDLGFEVFEQLRLPVIAWMLCSSGARMPITPDEESDYHECSPKSGTIPYIPRAVETPDGRVIVPWQGVFQNADAFMRWAEDEYKVQSKRIARRAKTKP